MHSSRKGRPALWLRLGLVVGGVLLGVYYQSVFQRCFNSLPVKWRVDIITKRWHDACEQIPLFCGLVGCLVGVFLLFFSNQSGLLMRAAPLAKRLCGFLPSAKLIAAGFLFFLPWIDIQCQYRASDGSTGQEVVARQSGMQVASGSYEDKSPQNPFRPPGAREQLLATGPEPAPLVTSYGLALALGILAGLTVRGRWSRLAAFGACSLAAVCLLLVQAQKGFPISGPLAEENLKLRADPQFRKEGSLVQGPPELIAHMTLWYYGAWILPVAACLAAGVDWCVNRKEVPREDSG
jgi:hypothetical protein